MSTDPIVLCGGWPPPALQQGQKALSLNLGGKSPNITLKISDISEKTAANIHEVIADLIEVAAYVYCADQATTRGGEGVLDVGAKWRRNFHFFIPVRQLSIWSRGEVCGALADTLGFLSEDTYNFTFGSLTDSPPVAQYLEFGGDERQVDEVLLFSGGLDSLGGAVQELVLDKRSVALVSHRSNPKLDRRQRDLVTDLRERCQNNPPLHIPVWVHKLKALGKEYTQRTRSFLYASLGAAVARMFGLSRLRFYENGITSLNLPISEQVIGTRASRTTHPQVLNGFAKLFGLLLQQDFVVENPFLWKTKTDVVNVIGSSGCDDLIRYTISCMHTRDVTNLHTHCGLCSQCIGRRFSTLASQFAEQDPAEMYKSDLLTGGRDAGVNVTMLEATIRTARAMESMSDAQFFAKFGEASRVLRHFCGTADEVATRILDLHRKYGADIGRTLTAAIADHAADIRECRLPNSCAIALAVPEKDKWPSGPTVDSTWFQQVTEGQTDAGAKERKPLSVADRKVFDIVGTDEFRKLSNQEITKRHKKQFKNGVGEMTDEAIRARLNRIRRHYRFPPSAVVRKKTVSA